MKQVRIAALTPFFTLALTGAISLGLATTSYAQGDDEKKDNGAERQDGERRGRRGRRGGRGMRGFMDADAMKKQLGLDDAQTEKMKTLMTEMRENMRKLREEGGGGRGGWEKMREGMQNMRKKMDEILTPEQREKYKKIQEERRGRFGRGGRRNAGQDFKRLRTEAIKSLALSEEESAVLVPLLDGVIETRKLLKAEAEKRRKTFLEKVRATSDEAELASLLKEFRAAKAADTATLKKSQTKLVEVLTPTQEAKLVAFNLLD